MSKARVVAVCSSDSWSGTEKWVLRACEELLKRKRKVRLVARSPELFSFRRTINLPVDHLSMGNQMDLKSVVQLAAHFRKHSDVVILTRVRDYWLGGLAARLAGVPVLLRLGVVRRLRDKYIMDRLRYGKLPAEILVNAEAIRESLYKTSWMKSKPVHVVYNGVDAPGKLPEQKKEISRKQLGVPLDDILILGAGRLAVEKRWDWFVNAFARLVDREYPVTARLLGRGNERDRILAQVREMDLSTHFLMPGERRDSHIWLAAADIVVLPSSNEGISNTMLEAMGREVPVIATQSGGVNEIFRNNEHVVLVDRDDFDGFAENLEVLVKDIELRKRVAKSGYSKVKELFTWSSMTDAVENIVDNLANA